MISSDEKKSIGLSAIASIFGMCAVIAPAGWWLVKPTLVSSVSTAMAADVEEAIDERIAPLNAGFKAILLQNINALRRQIAAAEYRQAQFPDQWNEADVQRLAQMQIDLDGQLNAYRAIVAAEPAQ